MKYDLDTNQMPQIQVMSWNNGMPHKHRDPPICLFIFIFWFIFYFFFIFFWGAKRDLTVTTLPAPDPLSISWHIVKIKFQLWIERENQISHSNSKEIIFLKIIIIYRVCYPQRIKYRVSACICIQLKLLMILAPLERMSW